MSSWSARRNGSPGNEKLMRYQQRRNRRRNEGAALLNSASEAFLVCYRRLNARFPQTNLTEPQDSYNPFCATGGHFSIVLSSGQDSSGSGGRKQKEGEKAIKRKKQKESRQYRRKGKKVKDRK